MSDLSNSHFGRFQVGLASRWYAIRFWIALLVAPIGYWFVRNTLSKMPSYYFNKIELALGAAWLGMLAFWTVRGSFSLPWRCLIGFSASVFACFLFACDISIAKIFELEKVPCDLRVLAEGLSYFGVSLAIHYLIAKRDRERLQDQLSAVIDENRARQVSIRFLLCLMTVSVFVMLILSRTYSWGLEATVNPRTVVRDVVAALPLASLTYLTARMTLRVTSQSHSVTYQLIVWCILVSPGLMLVDYLPFAASKVGLFEFYLFNCGAFLEYWCVTYFVMHTLRRANVVMQANSAV